jgi:hypothetical protein
MNNKRKMKKKNTKYSQFEQKKKKRPSYRPAAYTAGTEGKRHLESI